ncbi:MULTISPECIES: MaoC family dehydratase N-terminal domain-containing protein [Bacillaceae]|uniref:MaoC family dehydratase N-terminal domain-containing protein n=1 Tax=Bacillaceae TaxID=186817 RepID=UPI001C566BA7|nr:MaoC family dehydratase N-terminal domain-containing protein [Rossellomorea sp. YZS02]MBW3114499.1 MaoC family dehydratase N-terminal domain-containing protein [Bacillus sp. MCCB 382]MDX8344382.1 MaoC family dehydratase N-terminal domain-containing protein [Rossellomorea sp. YZS02]
MFQAYIGKRSAPVLNIVEKGAVKKFAEAIGDPHPIYVDEHAGKRSRYKGNIAPPTFPRVLEYGSVEGFHLPNVGLIHGEQSFRYERPLRVGEGIRCHTEIKDYYERNGTGGKLGFLVMEDVGEDMHGERIFTSQAIVIITETVRKRLSK